MFNAAICREFARQRRLSTEAFATKAGVDPSSIRRWLAGKSTPSPDRIVLLADALGVEPAALYVVDRDRRTLAYYRVIAGYSVRQLALELQVAHTVLWRTEQGRQPLVPSMRDALVQKLGVSAEVLERAWERAVDPIPDEEGGQQELELALAV